MLLLQINSYIYSTTYAQKHPKPETRISPRHPHISNPQFLLIIEYGIIYSQARIYYNFLLHLITISKSISTLYPYPYPLAIHSKTQYPYAIHSKIPFNFITAVIIPWASSDASLSHITYTLCGSLISHELHRIHSMRQPHIS